MTTYRISGNDTKHVVITGAPTDLALHNCTNVAESASQGRDVWYKTPEEVQGFLSCDVDSDTALEIARREAKKAWAERDPEWVEQELESISVDGTADANIGDCRVVTDCNVRDHEEVVSEHGGNRREAYIAAQAYLARGLSADGEDISYNEDGTKVWVEIVGPDGLYDRDDDMDGVDHDDSDVIDYAGLTPEQPEAE